MNTRTAVITGAAGGLGQATARRLLDAGFDVIAVTRDADSARTTRHTLTGGTVHTLHADLVDRDDLRALAGRLPDITGQVDVLINNAGAAFPEYGQTPDGVERTHALNHLAPFHLTHLLLEHGVLAADARIITISSDLVTRGRLDPQDPDITGTTWHDRFSQLAVYGTAKLMSLMATAALAERLPAGMNAYSANPGVIRTGFNAKSGGLLKSVATVSGWFAQSPDRAARVPAGLATATPAPQPTGGWFDKTGAATPPVTALDATLGAEIYERTAAALGLCPLPRDARNPGAIR
ncbi:SDR family NAD(P)-dependent oxidoreductase [Actinoplanes sp. NPDC026670]|uniref:SDR family NAD(P)-dependent oxidoreductase n=1 Tax=Actinoplanes sp. NPDC026670 TaxID=3154700 RepID=UPI0033CE7E19